MTSAVTTTVIGEAKIVGLLLLSALLLGADACARPLLRFVRDVHGIYFHLDELTACCIVLAIDACANLDSADAFQARARSLLSR